METLFSEDADVRRILLGLSALSGQEIKPSTTLIFLDEVQEVTDVVEPFLRREISKTPITIL